MVRTRSAARWLAVALAVLLATGCPPDGSPVGGVPLVTRVEVTPARSVIEVLDTIQLQAQVLGASGVRQDVRWTSSDTAVATIDEGGVLTGHADGQVSVTATSVVDSTVSGSAEVVVTSDALGLIEARFDIDLLREFEAVIATESITITFVPARHPPGQDIDARTSPPVFLGGFRFVVVPPP